MTIAITGSKQRKKLLKHLQKVVAELPWGWRDRGKSMDKVYDHLAALDSGSGIELVQRNDYFTEFGNYVERCSEFVFGKVLHEIWGDCFPDARLPLWRDTKTFLRKRGYTPVWFPQYGDVVAYQRFSLVRSLLKTIHFGIYTEKGKVLSKWGRSHIFEHNLDVIPNSPLNAICYFRTPDNKPLDLEGAIQNKDNPSLGESGIKYWLRHHHELSPEDLVDLYNKICKSTDLCVRDPKYQKYFGELADICVARRFASLPEDQDKLDTIIEWCGPDDGSLNSLKFFRPLFEFGGNKSGELCYDD